MYNPKKYEHMHLHIMYINVMYIEILVVYKWTIVQKDRNSSGIMDSSSEGISQSVIVMDLEC